MSKMERKPSARYQSPAKRKRNSSGANEGVGSTPRLGHGEGVNPFSYPPDKLYQFTLAGLSQNDQDPRTQLKDFPHKGLRRISKDEDVLSNGDDRGETETEREEDEEGVDQEDQSENSQMKKKRSKRAPDTHETHLALLVKAMQQFIDNGEIAKAARAFGIVLQLRPHGMPIDLRRDHLWALGAEIIMREGEDGDARLHDLPHEDEPFSKLPKRWGLAANMNKLRSYFNTIIAQHPYDSRFPKKVSALDFQLALFSCEVYSIHAENVIASARTDLEFDSNTEDEENSIYGLRGSYKGDGERLETRTNGTDNIQTRRTNHRKDDIRQLAVTAMMDVMARMDALMRELPYSKNPDYLRLRAMASFYLADLVVLPNGSDAQQVQTGKRRRHKELESAREYLRKILNNGVELDQAAKALLQADLGPTTATHLHASLPIREA